MARVSSPASSLRRTLTLRALSSPGPPPSQTPRFAEDDRASPDALAVTPEATLRVWDREPSPGSPDEPSSAASSSVPGRDDDARGSDRGPPSGGPPRATPPLAPHPNSARAIDPRERADRPPPPRDAPRSPVPSPPARDPPRRRPSRPDAATAVPVRTTTSPPPARAPATVPAPVPGPAPVASRGTRPGDLDLRPETAAFFAMAAPEAARVEGGRERAARVARASAPRIGAEAQTNPRVASDDPEPPEPPEPTFEPNASHAEPARIEGAEEEEEGEEKDASASLRSALVRAAAELETLRAESAAHRRRADEADARADAAGPTPLSLAWALQAAGDAADGSAAQLVLTAAEPWSPRTHALFPAGARAFAAELLLLGHRLSRQPRFSGEEVSLSDIWVEFVIPHAVVRPAHGIG